MTDIKFQDADFYDCNDREDLEFETPQEAVFDYLDSQCEPGCNALDVIKKACPLTVYAYKRMQTDDMFLETEAKHLLEIAEEDWLEVYGNPEADSSFAKEDHEKAIPALVGLLRMFYSNGDVYACDGVGSVTLDALQVEALMHEFNPEWFKGE